MRAWFLCVFATIIIAAPQASLGHAPDCNIEVSEYEATLNAIGDKHQYLISIGSVDENDLTAGPNVSVDRLEFLQSIPVSEFLKLIHSVNDLANCLHDTAHSHDVETRT